MAVVFLGRVAGILNRNQCGRGVVRAGRQGDAAGSQGIAKDKDRMAAAQGFLLLVGRGAIIQGFEAFNAEGADLSDAARPDGAIKGRPFGGGVSGVTDLVERRSAAGF